MKLLGRIDRVDTVESEGKIFVKIVDYKSGNKKFDIAALYYGLQLQLVLYMNAAVEQEKKRHPGKEVVPAAMLYYHVADDCLETETELTEEEINRKIREISGQTASSIRMRRLLTDSLTKKRKVRCHSGGI